MNDDDDDRALAKMAFGRSDHPDGSPLLADLSALPPTWIAASTAEVLLDDSILLAAALGRARVPVQLELVEDMMHLWTLWPDALDQGADTLARLGAALRDV
jgi:acetyl esterase/lipase